MKSNYIEFEGVKISKGKLSKEERKAVIDKLVLGGLGYEFWFMGLSDGGLRDFIRGVNKSRGL